MTTSGFETLDFYRARKSALKLDEGSKIAVIGGGPAGSFFSYFALEMAQRSGFHVSLDIYEPRDFSKLAPAGCNMCGGIISESLVQTLATEGINLPPTVVQRAIDSYILHMDVGDVRIETPLQEKRIGAVFRGPGPAGMKGSKWKSFDGFLQANALKKGAKVIPERVESVVRHTDGRILINTKNGQSEIYDLVAVAAGVSAPILNRIAESDIRYQPPLSTKTFITEFFLGEQTVETWLGSSMHVFLLNIPRLEFAAIIPKGDYVTLCLLGEEIDKELIEKFLNAAEVKQCFPPGFNTEKGACKCLPRISIRGARKPFADRMVFIGDSGISRLYKDGIGAAYKTAKAAAATAVLEGISEEDFEHHFWPACKRLVIDNAIGRIIFFITGLIQKIKFSRRAIQRMVTREQKKKHRQRMSSVLWDTFTGSAPYTGIFVKTLHPAFLFTFIYDLAASFWPFSKNNK